MRLSTGFVNIANVLSEPYIFNYSLSLSSNLVAPSSETQAEFLLSFGFLIVMIVDTGTINGLKLNE